MDTDSPLAAAAPAPWHAWLRFVLAIVGTAALTLGWGRVLIFTMFLGKPELPTLALFSSVFALVIALTWKLRPALRLPPTWTRFDSGLALGLLLLWCGAYAGLFAWYLASMDSLWQIYFVLLSSTLWVLFVAWFRWWPGDVRLKGMLLALLFVLSVDFPLLVEVADLTGEGRVNLKWRSHRPAQTAAGLAGARPSVTGKADLSAIAPSDFPRYLGAAGDGMLRGAKIAGDWTTSPPKLLWKIPVGAGWSSFAIVGACCVTQEQDGAEECVVCRKLRTGEEVWRHRDPVRFDGSLGGPGPRATPTVADGNVYSVGGTGLLNCLAGADGAKLWAVDLMRDTGATENFAHGVCGSPLVHAGKVFVSPPGADGKSLAAYDAATGKRLWLAGSHRASYGSPQLLTLLGTPQVVLYHSEGVSAHRPDDGKELWFFPWTNSVKVNASQPLLVKDDGKAAWLLLSTGYDKGSALVQLSRDGSDRWSAAEAATARRLQTKFTTAILFEGKAYGLDNGILTCLDPLTCKPLWKAGRYNHGQILLAGDRLIVQTEEGPVVLVEPNPKELIERGRLPALHGKTWNHPALAGRLLLLRNDAEAACYELP